MEYYASPREVAVPALMSIEDFYAEDDRRRTHGHQQFGFNWKDPNVADAHCYYEVRWYYGTHEIAAVYQTVVGAARRSPPRAGS